MVPDSCIDDGLSLAQWLKPTEEIEAQPAQKFSKAKYIFVIQFFVDFVD